MIGKVKHEGKRNIVEYIKKNSRDWSSNSDSRSNYSNITNRPVRLKTLPQAYGTEVPKVIADLKARLPDIRPKDVRRYCTPYYQAILLEFQEEEHWEAYHYMVELLKLDEQISAQTPGTMFWRKPHLKDQRDFINCLKNGLMAFDEGDFVMRATCILDMALFFQSKTWEWWWIAKRLYDTALSAAEEINDEEEIITLIRYLYGRFLFNELQDPREALKYVKLAREVSEGRRWNASEKLGTPQGSIFKESNILSFKILLILACEERSENPSLALQYSLEALERAQNVGNAEYTNEAYFELGKCYIANNDIKNALRSFSKLLALARKIGDIDGVCNAHVELAFAYKHLNDNENTEKHLRLCRENAEKFSAMQKLAHVHYYTGEHYLSQGKLYLSTSHLETALNLYNKLDLSSAADRARCIAGISKGQERIEKYINMILKCGEHDKNATIKLCRWKSRREEFWIDETDDAKSVFENQYEVLDSMSSSSCCTMD